MTRLVPLNATPIEVGVDEVVAGRFATLSAAVRRRWDPATCPVAVLPLLAWALSVDNWRSDWPDATKRAVIAASPRVHRIKGSVAAVRAAVSVFGLATRIVEWFQPGGSGEPHTATIEARLVAPVAVDGGRLVDDIANAARAAAPARVRLDVRLAVEPTAAVARIAFVRRPVTAAWLRSTV